MTAPDVASLLEEARSYLVAVDELEEDDAVPVDELVAQGEAVGYSAREVREVLWETDEVVAGDDALETVRVSTPDTDPEYDIGRGESPDNAEEDGRGGVSHLSGLTGETGRTELEAGVEPSTDRWAALDLSTEAATYPPELLEREQWMGQLAGEKIPFAPWGDASHPDGEPDKDARYKWGIHDMFVDGETVALAEDDPRLGGRVFLQQDDDPYAFVDGDDVRDPKTGDIHPAFLAFLDHLGVTYGDVSTSGSGVHAYYRGELPGDLPEAKWEIDSEPFGANDDPPAIEIYANTHVNVTTGDHLVGTGTEVRPWDDDALEAILEANDQLRDETRSTQRDDYDLDDYEPTATSSEETTNDIRDIFRALDRLDPKRVGERTIVREWTYDNRSFLPTWGSSDDAGTANYINDRIWHDTGHDGGYGGPLVMAAINAGLIEHTGASPADVRGKTFFEAVDHLRDLGFSIPVLEDTTSGDADPVAALPLKRLDQLDAEEARRYASKHGVDWPTTRNARERLRSSIMETMRQGDTRLHDAPTALGKSYTVATEPWLRRADTTGEAPVIHLSETREARDQAADASRDADVSHARLLGRSEACPIAAGEHDPATDDEEDDPDDVITKDGVPASDWFDRVCEGRGLPFSVAHKYLAEHNDQGADLPCCEEGECRSIAQWDGLPRDEDGEPAVDVIHATHGFAHVPSLRNGTNLIFDERPSFVADLTHDRVRKAVTAYLSAASAPTSTYEQFVSRTLRGDDTPNEHGEHAFISQALEYVPDREWYLEADDAHTLAPALTRAIYKALLPDDEEGDAADANGRYAATVSHKPPRLDKDASDDSTWNRTYVSVVIDEDLTVRVVRNSPSMAGARSVVGLDAHPDVTLWQQNVHPDILIDPVLGPSERALWRRYERGLLTVGVGDATRPLTSGEYFDEDGSRAFFGALRDHFGDRFSTAITAASVESQTADLLEDVGVDDPETMHYGEEKSRDDFGDEDVGALNGCIDPGDDYVLDLLAEAGLDARPETTTSDDGDEHRAHGRGFVGPDADAAASLLASVREQHVAQAAGRYARNADDPEDRAIVFVRTIAAPAGFLDLTVPGVEWLPTDAQQEIVETLRNQRKATARELAEAVDVSKEHVRKTLRRLSDTGVVDVHEGAGDHGAHLYRALAGLGSGETVDLTPETTNDPVWSTYTWSLAIDEPVDVVKPTVGTSRDAPAAADGVDAGDPLGDPPS